MNITDIKLRKYFTTGALEAVYSVTFDSQLVIHDIKLVRKGDELLLVMPSRKLENGEYKDIVHPITSEFRQAISEQIVRFHNSTVKGE